MIEVGRRTRRAGCGTSKHTKIGAVFKRLQLTSTEVIPAMAATARQGGEASRQSPRQQEEDEDDDEKGVEVG